MIKSMTNQVMSTLVHHKGKSWERQGKCIDKKKKNPWRKNLTMICRMSFACKTKTANWYALSPSLVKAIKFFLAKMSNYKMLGCFVATITVFYQLIQLSIFVTVGSLTLITTIKGWWILMVIIQYSWVRPWSIFKRVHRSFVGFCQKYVPKIRDLRTIGTDQEMAIFNGFSSILPNLNLLLYVYHL